jgi:hypothetical protein
MIDWSEPVMMGFGPSQSCGCPWEQWQVCGISLDLHYEPDGSVDVYADGGDWDRSFTTDSRDAAFKWVLDLPTEEEYARSLQ